MASFFSYESLYGPSFYKTHFKTGKQFYKHKLGYLAYEYIKGSYVVAGEPVAACREDSLDIMDDFMSAYESESVCGYYFSEDFVKQSEHSFYQLGVERIINLKDFNSVGYQWRDYRRALNKGREESLDFEELTDDPYDFAILKNIEERWLKSKGLPPMGFLLSRSQTSNNERYFLVKKNKLIQAYISVVNSMDNSVYVDQLVQSPEGHRWALDFAAAKLIETLKAEGKSKINFGLCAFHKINKTSLIEYGLSQLKHIYLYPSKSLNLFKNKYTNEHKNSYLLLDPKKKLLKQVKSLYRVTFPR